MKNDDSFVIVFKKSSYSEFFKKKIASILRVYFMKCYYSVFFTLFLLQNKFLFSSFSEEEEEFCQNSV